MQMVTASVGAGLGLPTSNYSYNGTFLEHASLELHLAVEVKTAPTTPTHTRTHTHRTHPYTPAHTEELSSAHSADTPGPQPNVASTFVPHPLGHLSLPHRDGAGAVWTYCPSTGLPLHYRSLTCGRCGHIIDAVKMLTTASPLSHRSEC